MKILLSKSSRESCNIGKIASYGIMRNLQIGVDKLIGKALISVLCNAK